jgi:hypothetical protein
MLLHLTKTEDKIAKYCHDPRFFDIERRVDLLSIDNTVEKIVIQPWRRILR